MMPTIHQLIARGRATYLAAQRRVLPEDEIPVAITGADLVTRPDFMAHLETCLAHVEKTGRSIQVLGPDGFVRFLVCQHSAPLARR